MRTKWFQHVFGRGLLLLILLWWSVPPALYLARPAGYSMVPDPGPLQADLEFCKRDVFLNHFRLTLHISLQEYSVHYPVNTKDIVFAMISNS